MGVDAQAIADFGGTLRGALLQPSDDDYDAARVVWNGMIDRRPRLIVRCHGEPMLLLPSTSHAVTVCWSLCAAAATTWPATPHATAA